MDDTAARSLEWGIAPPTHRLPATTRVGGVHLQVAELDRSLAYYTDVVGLRSLGGDGRRARLGAPGSDEALVTLQEHAGARSLARRGRLGLFHFAILLPDRGSLGAFVRHLVEHDEAFGASNHLVSEAVYLYDPDGLGIEVYADRPRASWRHQSRQLLMATEPMDVDGVMEAAKGAEWSGVPAGTSMGHLHLHVGDLQEAEAFYHRALGLDKTVWSYPGALFLSAGGYHHHLGLNTWAADAPPAGDDDARLLEWELVVPDAADVAAAGDSLEAAGGDILREEASSQRVVVDPWGTRLRVRSEV